MNWAHIAGRWKQLKGIARQRLGRTTGDYAGVIVGEREHRLGGIQVADGVAREAREKQLAEWLAREHKADPIHK